MNLNANVLNSIQYGIFSIGCKGDDIIEGNACIVNTVVQVTLVPLKIAVTISKSSYTNELVRKHGAFTVSVLSQETPLDAIRAIGFRSGRDGYKLDNVQCFYTSEGLPVFDEKISCWFACNVEQIIDLGSHTLFIAEVTETSRDIIRVPMTYEYYHAELMGKPTAINTELDDVTNSNTKEEQPMSETKTYTCTVCGYVYDGEEPFEDLPDDWVCPICGVGKELFTTD